MLIEIDRFKKRHNLTDAQFGRAAVNDAGFVRHLRRGRETTDKRAAKVRAYMAEADRKLEEAQL